MKQEETEGDRWTEIESEADTDRESQRDTDRRDRKSEEAEGRAREEVGRAQAPLPCAPSLQPPVAAPSPQFSAL